MLFALFIHRLCLLRGLGIITTITTQEVVHITTACTLIFITTPVTQVVLGTGITASGMAITIKLAGTGTALESWQEPPSSAG